MMLLLLPISMLAISWPIVGYYGRCRLDIVADVGARLLLAMSAGIAGIVAVECR
jgi:hypothetical protein